MREAIKAALPDPVVRWILRAMWRLHTLKDWWGTKVWTRTKEVVTPLGFKLASGFHPAYAMMRNGTFEPGETAVLTRLLADADLFVDVGANLGYYTLLAAKMGVPSIAFEPQPQNLRALAHNLAANGWSDRAEVVPLALSDRPGTLTLYGASGPSASLVRGWADYSPKHRQSVRVSTLDTILGSRFAGQRLLVKIDVEGAELDVLRGATTTMENARNSHWLVEICLSEFHPSGSNPDFQAIFDLFWRHGYRAFVAGEKPVPVSREDVDRWIVAGHTDTGVFNYLFAGSDAAL